MRKIEMKDLPENLGEDYLVLVSNSSIDLSSLDRLLNTNNVITGLVEEYTYINNSSDLVSILIRIDEDSSVHKGFIDKKINENLYVCKVNKYYETIRNYRYNVQKSNNEFNLSDRIYGYNDLKVIMKLMKNEVKIIILAPFTGSIDISDTMFKSLSGMFKLVYGYDLVREDIQNSMSSFILKIAVPLDVLKLYGRKNFDILMNQVLSIINIDKYTTLESISESKNVINLLN